MAVGGLYIAYRIRQMVLPFVRVYGQWVDERIIPMADQLEKMANAVEQEAYDNLMSQPAGDDYPGDGSDEAEAAHDIGISFYEDISNMYQATLNLFSAGLFHVMEQQLADLTRDGAIEKEASDTKLDRLIDWYKKGFQLDLEQFPNWWAINELRLVANSTKHGEGPAAKQLREKRPELFVYPALRKDDLLLQVDTNLEQIKQGGQLLQEGIERICHVCGVGRYSRQGFVKEIPSYNMRLFDSGSAHPNVTLGVEVWECGACHHIQFFRTDPRS